MSDDEKEIFLIFLDENIRDASCLPLFPIGIKSCIKRYGKVLKSMLNYINVLLKPRVENISCPKTFEEIDKVDYKIDENFLEKYSELFKNREVYLVHVRKNLDRRAINEALILRKKFIEDYPDANLKETYLLYYVDNKNLRDYARKLNLKPFRVEIYIYY